MVSRIVATVLRRIATVEPAVSRGHSLLARRRTGEWPAGRQAPRRPFSQIYTTRDGTAKRGRKPASASLIEN
ncbi:hypothetical protein [Burkholderia gladioli]|uniref:hypothetical protein n=1 Tax=Burkholderia gladioli TaxID=28095 RepID=UPI00164128DF|nr:hypothetical protein [Burkholderia gladioli]